MKKLILLAVIASALFSSCQKNSNPAPEAKNVPGGINAKGRAPVPVTTDVYAVGVINTPTSSSNNKLFAGYWKNGVPTILSNNNVSRASAITVVGSDVYAAGFDVGGRFGFGMPCYWKNGVEHMLPVPNNYAGEALAIAVQDTNVYVVGDYVTFDGTDNEPTRAMLWKNGVPTMLAFNKDFSFANSIALDGNDVYISGNAVFNGVHCAVYWKNNIWHPFAGTTNVSQATGIAVDSHHNYYISGGGSQGAGYWKDSNPIKLTDQATTPFTVVVNNDNVYFPGIVNTPGRNVSAYWINGNPVLIPINSNFISSMTAIAVAGNDVYSTLQYQQTSGNDQISYFVYKNTTLMQQLPNVGLVLGMTVVQH